MKRIFTRPIGVPIVLYILSGLTILFAAATSIQMLLDALPPESLRYKDTPISFLDHAICGVAFGVIGPLQFGRVLARKYGRLHRVLGRVFVVAGAFLSLSSLTLLWEFPDTNGVVVNAGRLVFGIALGIALIFAMVAIKRRNIPAHRDWMIRAYAIGMGATLVAIFFIPIFVITGEPPMGLASDILFIGSWAACVVFAEWLIRRINKGAYK